MATASSDATYHGEAVYIHVGGGGEGVGGVRRGGVKGLNVILSTLAVYHTSTLGWKGRKKKKAAASTCLELWVSQSNLTAGESRVFSGALRVFDVFHLCLQLVDVLQHDCGHLLNHLLKLKTKTKCYTSWITS